MTKRKLRIEISNPRTHLYSIGTGNRKNVGPTYISYVENVDGYLILKQEARRPINNIFGVTKNPEDADFRLHDSAKRFAQEFAEKYSHSFDTEIIDSTPRGKQLEIKLDSE